MFLTFLLYLATMTDFFALICYHDRLLYFTNSAQHPIFKNTCSGILFTDNDSLHALHRSPPSVKCGRESFTQTPPAAPVLSF